MTVPLRRLAGLWPWLLMAALQVVLGQPSMESGLRAVINVTLAKDPTGKPIVLKGEFVGGSAGNAQGKLKQYHPVSLCNTSEDERQDSGFITIVKLEQLGPHCSPLLDKHVVLQWKRSVHSLLASSVYTEALERFSGRAAEQHEIQEEKSEKNSHSRPVRLYSKHALPSATPTLCSAS